MEDLTIVVLFFAEVLLTVAIVGVFIARVYFLEHTHILSDKYLNIIKKKDLPLFYSTSAIRDEAFRKIFHIKPQKETVLCRLAVKNPQLATKILEHIIKKEPQNIHLLLLLAKLNHLLHRQNNFEHIIESIRLPHLLTRNIKAQYWQLTALNDLFQTDMLSASTNISKALKTYQKLKYSYEEAECYLILAQIYRISGVFDVAFTMLKEAKKIFKDLKIQAKIAETEAYFGLTEIGRENYKTAEEYLNSAAKICIKNKLNATLADIKNWQGLTAFLTQKHSIATDLFSQTLELTTNLPSLTFAAEMLARLSLKNKDFNLATKYVEKALSYAKQQKHRPAIFENLYLKAEIHYEQKNYAESRRILTEMIKEKNPPSAIYYPANAYTLLGLVEFMENNLSTAQTLFKQALDLEHAQNRLKGAAFDYNNLAELSKRSGNLPEAEKYLKQALKYAQEIDDKELSEYLQKKLN